MEKEPVPLLIKITCVDHGIIAPGIDNRLVKGIIEKHTRDNGCTGYLLETMGEVMPGFEFPLENGATDGG